MLIPLANRPPLIIQLGRISLLSWVLCACLTGRAQDSVFMTQYYNRGLTFYSTQYDSSYHYLNQAIQYAQAAQDPTSELYIFLGLSGLTQYHKRWEAFEKVLQRFGQRIALAQPQLVATEVDYFKANLFKMKAQLCAIRGEYIQSLRYFDQAEKSVELESELDVYTLDLLSSIFLYQSITHQRLGQYQQALHDQSKVETVDQYMAQSPEAMSLRKPGLTAKGFADIYQEIGNTTQAIAYYQQALDLFATIEKRFVEEGVLNQQVFDNRIVSTAIELSEIFISLDSLTTAEQYLQLALTHQQRNGPLIPYIQDTYGKLYTAKGDYLAARQILYQSLSRKKDNYGLKSTRVGKTYQLLAQTAFHQGELDTALWFTQAWLTTIVRPFDQMDIQAQPALSQIIAKPALLSALTTKSHLLRQRKTGTDLELAWQTIQLAVELIDSIRQDYTADYDKQYLTQQGYHTYEEALHIAYELYAQSGDEQILKTAFHMVEQSKGLLLREALLQAQASRFAGVSSTLVARERQIRAELKYVEDQWLDALLNAQPAEQWQTRLTHLQAQHLALLDTLSLQAPQFYRSAYTLSTLSADQVSQQVLAPDQVLIEYFQSDTSLFAFVLADGHTHLIRLSQAEQLADRISALREGLYGFQLLPLAQQTDQLATTYAQQYTSEAFALYQQLFKPLEPYLGQAKRMVLIPDGVLGYVPFETLLASRPELTVAPNWQGMNYLLQSYTFSYSYSATLLAEMQEKVVSHDHHDVLGFACTFGDRNITASPGLRNNLQPIPGAAQTVKAIGQVFPLRDFIDPDATKEAFVQQAPQYEIIHLATHGILDDKEVHNSFLAFYGANDSNDVGKLYLRDIYQLDLQAKLVVLGACETGLGELKRGEGVVSLARGFSYAGAQSIVPTLWSVSDVATTLLMERFYANLAEGMTKDEALRQARLAYLNEAVLDQSFLHPFYWGATIVVGDSAPIQPQRTHWLFWLIGLMILLGVGGWIVSQRRKNLDT